MSALEPELEDAHVAGDDAPAEAGIDPGATVGEPAATPLPAVAPAEVSLEPLKATAGPYPSDEDLSLVLDVPVELSVEMGRATMTIRETLAIGPGSIIALNRLVGEPVDLFANGRLIARGEVIAIDEEYGLRVTEVLSSMERAA